MDFEAENITQWKSMKSHSSLISLIFGYGVSIFSNTVIGNSLLNSNLYNPILLVYLNFIDETFAADLVDMNYWNKYSNNRYILTVIDVFSKFAWGIAPLSYISGVWSFSANVSDDIDSRFCLSVYQWFLKNNV